MRNIFRAGPRAALMLACLACSAAFAGEEPRLEPGIYLEIPFGGPRAAPAGTRFTARLDYGGGVSGAPTMPALLQWHLDGGKGIVELAGLPLVQTTGYRMEAGDGARGDRVTRAVGIGATTTLIVGGLAYWAVSEALEDFGDAMGEAVVDEMFAGDDDETEPEEACSGVQVGEECLGGG